MNNIKILTVCVIIFILSVLGAFLLGRCLRVKSLESSSIKMEQSLKNAQDKLKEVEKRNFEMEEILYNSQLTVNELSKENEVMKNKLNRIENISSKIDIQIESISETSLSGLDKIIKIQENQVIINKYIEEIKNITE